MLNHRAVELLTFLRVRINPVFTHPAPLLTKMEDKGVAWSAVEIEEMWYRLEG